MSFITNPSAEKRSIVPSTDRRVCVLLNHSSGKDDKSAIEARLERGFARHPGRFELRTFAAGEGLADMCQRAMKDGFGTIVAAGGDGTISGVAGQVAGTGRRMGVLPLGTFNFVARGLGIPEDLDEAIDLIASTRSRTLPVGEVNGRIFLNNASLGIYPAVLRQREGTYKRWGRSQIAAHWSVLRTFLSFRRPVKMRVTVGGETARIKTPLAFVARSSFQLDHYGLEGADAVRDGKFALYLAPDVTRWQLLSRALLLATKGMVMHRDFSLFTGSEILIETSRRRQLVAMDGERLMLNGPFRFRMHPDALIVAAPEAGPGDLPDGGGSAPVQ